MYRLLQHQPQHVSWQRKLELYAFYRPCDICLVDKKIVIREEVHAPFRSTHPSRAVGAKKEWPVVHLSWCVVPPSPPPEDELPPPHQPALFDYLEQYAAEKDREKFVACVQPTGGEHLFCHCGRGEGSR